MDQASAAVLRNGATLRFYAVRLRSVRNDEFNLSSVTAGSAPIRGSPLPLVQTRIACSNPYLPTVYAVNKCPPRAAKMQPARALRGFSTVPAT